MRVLIAPDKFKGSLEAPEVAAAVAAGLRRVRPDLQIDQVPVADGGEGTVAAAVASGYQSRTVRVTGPLGDPVTATFAVGDGVAVVEMAAASGLDVLPASVWMSDRPSTASALAATSTGTGELIVAALQSGVRRIVLGVGGSACTDGGAGMARALGARLLTRSGQDIAPGGEGLLDLDEVDLSRLDDRLAGCEFVLAADVDNPLLGPRGAAAVFAPQKGADPQGVAVLEQGLTRWADRLASALGTDAATIGDRAGAGAAGGVGFAALALLGAERRSGIDEVLDLVHLDERLVGVELVVTGEGSLDEQSLGGKTPIGVARRAAAHQVPRVVAVCGRRLIDDEQARAAGFEAVYAVADRAPDPRSSMQQAARFLSDIGADLARTLPVT